MRIISRRLLKEFWLKYPNSERSLKAWYADIKHAVWKKPQDIKNVYQNASFLTHNRVVFNIKGNQYRLIVAINYDFEIVYLRFIGTHAAYDKINAMTI